MYIALYRRIPQLPDPVMLSLTAVVLLLAFRSSAAQAQTPPVLENAVPSLAFETSSIKPDPRPNERSYNRFTPDGFEAQNCTIRDLVRLGFVIKDDRLIVNLPDDKGTSYDIIAKVAEEDLARFKQLTSLQKQSMLQGLLVERFHLKFHWSSKELPVYAMVVDKGGIKLAEAIPDAEGKIKQSLRVTGRYTAVATGWAAADFFGLLTQMSGRYVVDRTNLKGKYSFTLRFAPYDPTVDGRGEGPFDGPVIFTALREQLGLALEPTSAMLDAIVIDHIEGPTPN